MHDQDQQRPGASGRRWEARFRAARTRRHGASSVPSSFESAIAKGAAGEELLGCELTALAQEMGLAVLHDLALPGESANIDHLVVGPAGVTVVDAKTWEGRVWVGRKTMRRGRFSAYRAITGVEQQMDRVRAELATSGRGEIPIDGVLCMVNDNPGVPADALKRSAGVGVGNVPTVRRHVARAGSLDVDQIRQVGEILGKRFMVSGGAYQPSVAPPVRAAEPDFIDKLISEINQDHRSRRKRKRRRVILATVAGFVLLAGAGGLLPPPEGPAAAPLERADLDRMGPQLRALAERRAGGTVRGPRVRTTASRFELLYRRGERCRVRVVVRRSDRSRSVRSAGCAFRR